MLVMLGFGSSARRGAAGWTDRERVRSVLDLVQPDVTVDGASPAGGADDIVNETAWRHFIERNLDTDRARRCPMDPALDGPGGRAFLRRNERMFRTRRPSLAVGFVSGKVGSPLSAGSAAMARICLYGLDDVPPCPVVVYRADGVEPYGGLVLSPRTALAVAVDQMRRLFWATRDDALVVPGKAIVAFWEHQAPRDEVLAALRFAADGSRWAPWIDAVIATVGLVS
jgi:hypothetical protein